MVEQHQSGEGHCPPTTHPLILFERKIILPSYTLHLALAGQPLTLARLNRRLCRGRYDGPQLTSQSHLSQ